MSAASKWIPKFLRRAPLTPIQFPPSGFQLYDDTVLVEEEQLEEYKDDQYYPVRIGDVYDAKYQVLGKLGFGTTSTVWLGRNLNTRDYVALKVFTRSMGKEEFDIYGRLSTSNPSHPGFPHVRTASATIELLREGGHHRCLIQKPMWDSWRDTLRKIPRQRFPADMVKSGIGQLLLALDYAHTQCQLVHTDLKCDNIFSELVDEAVLDAFVKDELDEPAPRKITPHATLYPSRRFRRPRVFGDVVLGDFGNAVSGELKRNHLAQPEIYRSPEVLLAAAWSYPIDIWNVGVLLFDVYEGKILFRGKDPIDNTYTSRAHLAEIVSVLGPPPLDFLQRSVDSAEFFTKDGNWKADIPIPPRTSLDDHVTRLQGDDKALFLDFVQGMLQWRPEDRKTARQLLEHPWLRSPGVLDE